MVDLWNPNEGKEQQKPSRDYYLVEQYTGKILQVIVDDMLKAVKTAQLIMSRDKIKVKIIPRKGT